MLTRIRTATATLWREHWPWLIAGVGVLLGLLFLLAGCWSAPAPATRTVPAEAEATRLRATEPPAATEARDLRAQELAAGVAAAQAAARGDDAAASMQQRLAQELARLRVAAEERAVSQRAQLAALAADADARAVAEREELDARAAAAERAADARRVEAQRQADRRWAGWGLALAAVAGVALRLLGLPSFIALAAPAAIAVGCLVLAAWSSVPWLATVLGIALAAGALIGIAVVGRHLLREWICYADDLHAASPVRGADADAESRTRQPRWVRWVIDHLLPRHQQPSSMPAASGPAPAPDISR